LVLLECPDHTDTSAETTAPLADSSIHDRLVKARPLVDQTRFKFVDISYSGSVNFLPQYTTDAIVGSGEFGGQCWRNEVGHLSLQETDGVSCSMRQCTVLLRDKTRPGIFGICLAVASGQEDCSDCMPDSL